MIYGTQVREATFDNFYYSKNNNYSIPKVCIKCTLVCTVSYLIFRKIHGKRLTRSHPLTPFQLLLGLCLGFRLPLKSPPPPYSGSPEIHRLKSCTGAGKLNLTTNKVTVVIYLVYEPLKFVILIPLKIAC